jgi:membrane-associated phospholipid phosphatase
MPQPLVVFGAMYIVYASFHIISYLKDGYWSGILSNVKNILVKQVKYVIAFLMLVILVITFIDKPISDLCRHLYNINVYTATDFINHMGEGWFLGGTLFTIAIILEFLKRKNDAVVFKIAFMVSTLAGLLNSILKFVFNRERPVIGDNHWHFFHFFVTGAKHPSDLMYAYNSMPSGHTITVVSALTVLFCYSQTKISRFILVILGFLIAYARVYTLNHWPSDVITSAVMGIVIGYAGYVANKKRILAQSSFKRHSFHQYNHLFLVMCAYYNL